MKPAVARRRHAARRVLVALVLMSTIPLRALAGVAMPCCPMPAAAMSEAMSDTPLEAMTAEAPMRHDGSTTSDRHDGSSSAGHSQQGAPSSACCAMAAIGPAAAVVDTTPPTPATFVERPLDAVAAFLTDAPLRPPRPKILPA